MLYRKKKGEKSGFPSFTKEKRLQKEALPKGANLVSIQLISSQCALQLGKISQSLQSDIWNHLPLFIFEAGPLTGIVLNSKIAPHLYHNIYNRVTPSSSSPTNTLVAVRMVIYKCCATPGLEKQPKNNAAPRISKKGHGRICWVKITGLWNHCLAGVSFCKLLNYRESKLKT